VNIQNSNLFFLGGHHTIMVVKVCFRGKLTILLLEFVTNVIDVKIQTIYVDGAFYCLA
jgi:hypothetical protein